MGAEPRRTAALLHPVAISSVVVLLVNDHVLKSAWPGLVTGKLSDVAALIVAPVAAAAIWQRLRGDRRRLGVGRTWPPAEVVIAVGVAVWFAAVKLDPRANDLYAAVMGLVGWPLGIAADLLGGRPLRPPGPAPTVMDAGDLLALPAVLVGLWLARVAEPEPAGAPVVWTRVRPVLAAVGRVVVLGVATFALAATSYAPPRVVTDAEPDVVTVVPDEPPIHRQGTIRIGAYSSGSAEAPAPVAVRVQARARWPFNDPPVRFVVSIDGAGSGDVAAVDPARCSTGCTLSVDVAIDWPNAAGRPPSSVAWELVATADASGTTSGYSAPSVSVQGSGFSTRSGGAEAGAVLTVLTVAPLLAFAIGRRLRGRLASAAVTRTDRARWVSVAMVVAVVGLVLLLVGFIVLAATSRATEPLGRSSFAIRGLAAVVGAGLVVGVVRWLGGSGVMLAVVVATSALTCMPVAAYLVGSASPSFAAPGLLAGLAFGGLLAVVGLLAVTRWPSDDVNARADRLAVLVTQLALLAGMYVALTSIRDGTGTIVFLLHALAVWLWWGGSHWLLALTSLAIAGLTGLVIIMGGPTMFGGPRWSTTDSLLQWAVVGGAAVGLAAALGLVGARPWSPKPLEAGAQPREPGIVQLPDAVPPDGDRR